MKTEEKNRQPVATSRPVQQETEIERDITKLESRMARIEETIDLMSRGVQMTLKRYSGVGLSDSEFDDLTKKINEIHEDLYGEPEETEEK